MGTNLLDTVVAEEVSTYLTQVQNLDSNPSSQRIFSEVHSAGRELLDRFGVNEGSWLNKKRVFEFIDPDSETALKIEYNRYSLTSKFMDISYIAKGDTKKTLVLATALGIQNIRELESGDEVTRISRGGMGLTSGEGLRKIVETFTQFQPDSLLRYQEGILQTKNVYSK